MNTHSQLYCKFFICKHLWIWLFWALVWSSLLSITYVLLKKTVILYHFRAGILKLVFWSWYSGAVLRACITIYIGKNLDLTAQTFFMLISDWLTRLYMISIDMAWKKSLDSLVNAYNIEPVLYSAYWYSVNLIGSQNLLDIVQSTG